MGFALAFFLHTEGQAPLLALLIFPPKTAAQMCSMQPHLCVRWTPRTTRKFFFFVLHPALRATQQHHCHQTWFASFIRHNNRKMLEGRNSSRKKEQFRGFSAGGTKPRCLKSCWDMEALERDGLRGAVHHTLPILPLKANNGSLHPSANCFTLPEFTVLIRETG